MQEEEITEPVKAVEKKEVGLIERITNFIFGSA